MTAKVRKSAALTSDRDREPSANVATSRPDAHRAGRPYHPTAVHRRTGVQRCERHRNPAVAASIRQAIGELDDALHDIHVAALAASGRVPPTRLTMEPSELCEP
jgi:hypothetical protein